MSFVGKDKRKKESWSGFSCGVQEAEGRIWAMRQWRKELERSVCWQREEYWPVEHAMGRKENKSMGKMEGSGTEVTEGTSRRKWDGRRGTLSLTLSRFSGPLVFFFLSDFMWYIFKHQNVFRLRLRFQIGFEQ